MDSPFPEKRPILRVGYLLLKSNQMNRYTDSEDTTEMEVGGRSLTQERQRRPNEEGLMGLLANRTKASGCGPPGCGDVWWHLYSFLLDVADSTRFR